MSNPLDANGSIKVSLLGSVPQTQPVSGTLTVVPGAGTFPVSGTVSLGVGAVTTMIGAVFASGTTFIDHIGGTAVTALALAVDTTSGRTSADIIKPEGAIGVLVVLDITTISGVAAFSAAGMTIQVKSINGNYINAVIYTIGSGALVTVRLASFYTVPGAANSSGSHTASQVGTLADTIRVVTLTGSNASNAFTYSVQLHWLY